MFCKYEMWNALQEAHSKRVYENAISTAAWCLFDFQLQFHKIDSSLRAKPPAALSQTPQIPHLTLPFLHNTKMKMGIIKGPWNGWAPRQMHIHSSDEVLLGWSLFWMHSFCEGCRRIQISNMFIHLRWEADLNRTQYVIN